MSASLKYVSRSAADAQMQISTGWRHPDPGTVMAVGSAMAQDTEVRRETGDGPSRTSDEVERSLLEKPFSKIALEMVADRTGKSVQAISANIGPLTLGVERYPGSFGGFEWGPDTARAALTAHRFFIDVCGDKRVCDIQKSDMRRFRDALEKLPRDNGKGVFAGLSVPAAIELADAIEKKQIATVTGRYTQGKISKEDYLTALANARVPRLSMATINRHLGYVNQVSTWLNDLCGIDGPNWSRGILFRKRRRRASGECQRPRYEDEDLRIALLSPVWTGCKSGSQRSKMGAIVIKDALYWSLPIAALAGLRLEEMARLRLEHVVEVDGIWCFVVSTNAVLTHARSRLVPIHSTLLRLGLLDRVERLRGAGHDRLFPELRLDPCHNRYGTTLTRRLARYLKAIGHGVPGRGYSGARLKFGDTLMKSGISDEILSALLGYARPVGPFERFVKNQRLWDLKEAIETVDYDLPLVERDGQWHLAPTR